MEAIEGITKIQSIILFEGWVGGAEIVLMRRKNQCVFAPTTVDCLMKIDLLFKS